MHGSLLSMMMPPIMDETCVRSGQICFWMFAVRKIFICSVPQTGLLSKLKKRTMPIGTNKKEGWSALFEDEAKMWFK